MYKYSDDFDSGFSLHDCRATEITLDTGSISFVIPNGICVLASNANNPTGKHCYTDRAEITFSDPCFLDIGGSCTVYLYSCTDDKNTDIREEIPAQKLAEMLRNGAELEFLYTFVGFRSYLFKCWLWFHEEPYHKECELIISAEETLCCWNELHEEDQ